MVTGTVVEDVTVGARIQVWPGDDDYTPGIAIITDIAECESGFTFKVDRDGQPFEFNVRSGEFVSIVS